MQIKMEKQIYNLSSEEVLEKFASTKDGLSGREVEKRIKENGLNKLQKKTSWKWLKIIWNQFNDALVWILLVAAALAFVFHEMRDVTIIVIIIGINATIGFFQ